MTPILVIGDSNTVAFNNILVECPEFFAQPFVTRSAFCRQVTCENFTDRSGNIHPAVAEALFAHFAAVGPLYAAVGAPCAVKPMRAGRPRTPNRAFHFPGAAWQRFREIANDHIESPVIVIVLGTAELHAILQTLPAGCDFALDDARFDAGAFAEKPVGPYVPAKLVNDLVASRLEPLARGIAVLRKEGFDHVYLHSLHPPAVEDYKYTNVRMACTQAWLRYKVALTINAHFRALCERYEIRFVDMWDDTTAGGLVDPRFELDGDHLNKEAAYLSVKAVLADLAGRVLPKRLELDTDDTGAAVAAQHCFEE